MAFKVNYGLERAERNRAKQAKKEAKAQAKKAGGAEPEPEAVEGIAAIAPAKPEGEQ
jgi:hypothetical protein